ncbi:murinoglobulin-1-like [Anneissia japonica]|uniref:murinoglobulin-1-like n=1 Tax=Anneissia japonica TaxID=1529436 RepID=UPI001425715E|nr:murinoglobulin-1-like [Anneissia japonica]
MLLKTAVLVCIIFYITVPVTQADNESSRESKYLIMAPKVMVAETTESVCIQLMNMTGPIYISVKLMDGDLELKRIPLYFMEFPFACLQIEVPKVSKVERFEATLSVTAFDHDDIRQLFNTSKKVHVDPRNSKTFIQTDKPIYKPGQAVKFRILTLDQNLRPKLDMIEKVYIEAPNGVRLSQWINVTTQDGLVELEFQLTSEPQLGTWTIFTLINGLKTTQEFDVDEYVLPSAIYLRAWRLGACYIAFPEPMLYVRIFPDIKAISEEALERKYPGYTYGQPVFGNIFAEVTVKNEVTHNYERQRPTTRYLKEADANGCAEFLVDAERYELQNWDYSLYNAKIYVYSYIVEQGTGIELSNTDFTGIVARSPLDISIEALATFKPGLPFYGKILVTKPDGVVSPNTAISITARANYGVIFAETLTTDNSGYITFSLSNITIQASTVSIKVCL